MRAWSREQYEQKILDIVAKVAGDPERETGYTEMWFAHSLVRELADRYPGEEPMQITSALVAAGHGLIWASFLSDALSKMEAQHSEIAEGIDFEYDGATYRAVNVEVLQGSSG